MSNARLCDPVAGDRGLVHATNLMSVVISECEVHFQIVLFPRKVLNIA